MVTAGNSTCDLLVTLMLVVTGWDWKSELKLARLLTVMSEKKANMRAHTSILILGVNSIESQQTFQQTFQQSFYSSKGHPVVLETLLKSLLRFQQSY